jgi:hypothetical protein
MNQNRARKGIPAESERGENALNRQNPIQALQPSLPEAPFWANAFELQAGSVRGIESKPRYWGTVSTPYPANSGRI